MGYEAKRKFGVARLLSEPRFTGLRFFRPAVYGGLTKTVILRMSSPVHGALDWLASAIDGAWWLKPWEQSPVNGATDNMIGRARCQPAVNGGPHEQKGHEWPSIPLIAGHRFTFFPTEVVDVAGHDKLHFEASALERRDRGLRGAGL
jgi:hypothetical protein